MTMFTPHFYSQTVRRSTWHKNLGRIQNPYMLELLQNLSPNTVGVRATGKVTKQEYEEVLMPALDALSKTAAKINLMLLLETDISHFTPGAWMNDMIIGLKYFTKWHRVAILTEQKGVQKFTDIFGHLVPGQYKGFSVAELELAKEWVTDPVK